MRGARYGKRGRGHAREPEYPEDAREIIKGLGESSARDWIALIALIALGVGLGQLQSRARNGGRIDPVSGGLTTLVAMPGQGLANGADRVRDFGAGVAGANSLVEENRRLKAQAGIIGLYSETVERLNHDLEKLDAAVGMPNFGRQKVFAPVWGLYPTENRITIGAGSNKGVAKGMPVVSPDGLVGIVQSVDGGRAQVQLITSPLPFKFGAMVDGAIPGPGLIHGEAIDRLNLDFTDMNVAVKSGDSVVTSGYHDRIPRGIPVGRVVTVEKDPNFGRKTAIVFPYFQLGSLRQVVVLK